MDLRMIKTRRDIRNALLDLLDDNRSFESITVSQIARRANISRSTFYDHYSDKYALLNALFDEDQGTAYPHHGSLFLRGGRHFLPPGAGKRDPRLRAGKCKAFPPAPVRRRLPAAGRTASG